MLRMGAGSWGGGSNANSNLWLFSGIVAVTVSQLWKADAADIVTRRHCADVPARSRISWTCSLHCFRSPHWRDRHLAAVPLFTLHGGVHSTARSGFGFVFAFLLIWNYLQISEECVVILEKIIPQMMGCPTDPEALLNVPLLHIWIIYVQVVWVKGVGKVHIWVFGLSVPLCH